MSSPGLGGLLCCVDAHSQSSRAGDVVIPDRAHEEHQSHEDNLMVEAVLRAVLLVFPSASLALRNRRSRLYRPGA